MVRFLTAGESHGPALVATVEGMPAGLAVTADHINHDLARRQIGYGRGKRMEIETDRVEFVSGIRLGLTLGSPVTMLIHNSDWPNWIDSMNPAPGDGAPGYQPVTRPRPGHTDLAGAIKYGHRDMRNVLERSSARETTARVAAGALCRRYLTAFGIRVFSLVRSIGGIAVPALQMPPDRLARAAEKSTLRCPCPETEARIMHLIDRTKAAGDSLGGVFEVHALGVPVGLGSHVQWDRRLDGRIAQALMSIQAIKGVEIGMGFDVADHPGSAVHDPIAHSARRGYYRRSNNAGGIEGGISNGEAIVVRAAMKPIATLYTPLRSVDITTRRSVKASVERSDICRVPSAAVIGEAMLCLELARAVSEKFGGDSMPEVLRNYTAYCEQVEEF